jgi:hypothetical protein
MLHLKHRLPADTPVARFVGNLRNVAPVPLRPDLRRQRRPRPAKPAVQYPARTAPPGSEVNKKKLCKRAFFPPAKYDELWLRAIAAQRAAPQRLRAGGEIGEEASHSIQEELDCSELDAAPAKSFQSLA